MKPWEITVALAADASRKAKEAIVEAALTDPEAVTFFEGCRLAYDSLITFGVKKVPEKAVQGGQGFPWTAFIELTTSLNNRTLSGNAAQDAIKLAMDCATQEQWNFWYRPILIKDLRCGLTERTVNTVVEAAGRLDLVIPVFSSQLAQDGTDHPKKCKGKKMVDSKLDGMRMLTIVYPASASNPKGRVDQYSRNGKELLNFEHTKKQFIKTISGINEPVVFDGEIMSSSFQDLMKQARRKENVNAGDAVLHLFDLVTLAEFNQGIGKQKQITRSEKLQAWKNLWEEETPNIQVVGYEIIDLDTEEGNLRFNEINRAAIEGGFEGIMLKNLDAVYECKRTHSWLKVKPVITVDLVVVALEEGTGKNTGKMGALVCEGTDNGKFIRVNVGSGLTDEQRAEFWANKESVLGQVVEIKADVVTKNQDSDEVYSLRFPRFERFRGFAAGEKL